MEPSHVYCLAETNACHVNNGGCDKNAVCTVDDKLSSLRVCNCTAGYTGDGIVCLGEYFKVDP